MGEPESRLAKYAKRPLTEFEITRAKKLYKRSHRGEDLSGQWVVRTTSELEARFGKVTKLEQRYAKEGRRIEKIIEAADKGAPYREEP